MNSIILSLLKNINVKWLSSISLIVYLILLIFVKDITLSNTLTSLQTVSLTLSVFISVLYIVRYRMNSLLCYEFFFFPVYILSMFFTKLILENVSSEVFVSSVLSTSFSNSIEAKGHIIQMIALLSFVTASSFFNDKYALTTLTSWQPLPHKKDAFYKTAVTILTMVMAVYIAYLAGSEVISSWFHYSGNAIKYTNTDIVYCTIILLVLTVLESIRLYIQGCNSIGSFVKGVNKLYIGEILLIAGILLMSGNRNESLLIILPLFVAYSTLIKSISNRMFFIGLFGGIVLMIIVGLTRQDGIGTSVESTISLYDATRDFGMIDRNSVYLVEYTDKHEPIGFSNAIGNLFSSVPFLGGIAVDVLGIESDIRSTELTTLGMQVTSNMDSGLGTSLVGDLYYTGKTFFVVLFMLFMGWFNAYSYNKLFVFKSINPWILILYLFNFANVVYYVRAEWTMPFRYIGFAFTILLILGIIKNKK